ncbi:MAG: hypothetical protein H6654_16470 [Ardenticatenaceae bacterium]|nr:hypothetical protein [Anaerolineales bacterium]MCB8939761.1 hypothetical protein [Ardenticatenaceae bacterium]MCB8975155.1 hypothetical protein [Ardenticatenaceae bacterium]
MEKSTKIHNTSFSQELFLLLLSFLHLVFLILGFMVPAEWGLVKWLLGGIGAGFPALLLGKWVFSRFQTARSPQHIALRSATWAYFIGGALTAVFNLPLGVFLAGFLGPAATLVEPKIPLPKPGPTLKKIGNILVFAFMSIVWLFLLHSIIESWPTTLIAGTILFLVFLVAHWTVKKSPIIAFAILGATVGHQLSSTIIHMAERGQKAWLESFGNETVTFLCVLTGIIACSALSHVLDYFGTWQEAKQQEQPSS